MIDDAQGLGPEALQLLRALIPEGQNDLFLAGDAHQRIYARRASLKSCGTNIVGRGNKLRINYRTTDQIRRFATAILKDVEIDDLDGGVDDYLGYKSLVSGAAPTLKGFPTAAEEAAWVVSEIKRLHEQEDVELRGICIAARTRRILEVVENALEAAELPTVRVSRDVADDASRSGVRLATMHRIKGLEFRHLFVIGISDGVVPLRQALERASDEVERRNIETNERALLHVAITRAVRSVAITWSGEVSGLVGEVKLSHR